MHIALMVSFFVLYPDEAFVAVLECIFLPLFLFCFIDLTFSLHYNTCNLNGLKIPDYNFFMVSDVFLVLYRYIFILLGGIL